MVTRTTYIEQRRVSLKALDREIARMTHYQCGVTTDAALQYDQAIRGLQVSRDKAAKMLQAMRAPDGEALTCEDATQGMENAWGDVRTAVLAAISATYGDACRGPANVPINDC